MTDVAQLARRLDEMVEEQRRMREALEESNRDRDAYHKLYLEMLERNRELERGLLASKTERLTSDEQQLSMALLGMLLPDAEAAETAVDETDVKPHKRRKGRNKIPEHIPRIEHVLLPPEVEAQGEDAFDKIGEEVTEVWERRPSVAIALRFIKPKYMRKDRAETGDNTVYVAQTPAGPIVRGAAGPGMMSDTIVKRFDDHLPLNRQERVYGREGIELARSTICGWHIALAELCQPVIDAMRHDAIEQPYLCTDATGVLVQAKERCRTGHFWVMVAPERHVLFEFTKKHNSAAVDSVLAGYEGYLVADAHAVYDHLYRDGPVTEVNCWAHARRYFFQSMSSDPERARFALGHINGLFRIERSIADSPRKKREKIRRSKSAPILDRFLSWCEAERDNVLDDTPLAKGIRYALNQREGLSRFLKDGRLPIHNNMSELQLRREAVGRNYAEFPIMWS